MKDLILAIRRYLGDRAPGEPGGDIADIRAAIERAEASTRPFPVGPSSTACDDQTPHTARTPASEDSLANRGRS